MLARLPGQDDSAILVPAHYDSPPESVGAGANAAAVGAAFEMLRVLAAGPPLAHSVVVNFNGAEEPGLLGAVGFLQHRWAQDVRVFLNLEGVAPGSLPT